MSSAPLANLALSSKPSLQIRIENGEQGGEILQWQKPVMSIGRGPENDLSFVNDPKMSRLHAEIKFEDGQYWIKNVSAKNFILVNGVEVMSFAIQSPVKLQVGETLLTLGLLEPVLKSVPSVGVNSAQAPAAVLASVHKPSLHQAKAFRAPQAPVHSKTRFYIVVAVVLMGLAWLFLSESNAKKKASSLRTSDQVMMDLQQSESIMKQVEKRQEEQGSQTLQYKLSQEHYLKGFRDYRQGQYARAMSSFQASLSFYPQHELARKYYSLSKRKFDELVQSHMIQGKRNRGKNNYRLCRNSYANVMIMVKDPNDPIYREAKQYYNECTVLSEGHY